MILVYYWMTYQIRKFCPIFHRFHFFFLDGVWVWKPLILIINKSTTTNNFKSILIIVKMTYSMIKTILILIIIKTFCAQSASAKAHQRRVADAFGYKYKHLQMLLFEYKQIISGNLNADTLSIFKPCDGISGVCFIKEVKNNLSAFSSPQ